MSWLFICSYVRLAPAVDQGRNEPGDCGLRLDEGLTGSYSGPEVGFEEIALVLPQARFWIVSLFPTTRQVTGRRRAWWIVQSVSWPPVGQRGPQEGSGCPSAHGDRFFLIQRSDIAQRNHRFDSNTKGQG